MQVIRLLTDLRNRLNIDRNMTENQIALCATDIVDSQEFYMLRIEDFELCFKQAYAGAYGEFYGRLDQPMVFGFLRKYSQERDQAIARKRDSETDRSNIYDLFQTDAMKGILKDVTDKLTIKEANEAPKIERKPDIFQIILKEWGNLPPSEIGGLKTYQNKPMDTTEFLQVRVNELLEGRE